MRKWKLSLAAIVLLGGLLASHRVCFSAPVPRQAQRFIDLYEAASQQRPEMSAWERVLVSLTLASES